MSETPQSTQTDAIRDETGTIQDQSQKTETDRTVQETKPTQQDGKVGDKGTDDSKTLLNKDQKTTAESVPEKYEAFKTPEGYELDAGVVEEAAPLFKELGLTQSAAQRLVDFYSKHAIASHQEALNLVKTTQERWVSEVKSDPEIGSKLDQVRATVSKAIDSLGDPKLATDFREAMDFTGAGNNPAFIRAFYRLAQKVVEPGHVSGSGPSKFGQARDGGQLESAAKALYPNLP